MEDKEISNLLTKDANRKIINQEKEEIFEILEKLHITAGKIIEQRKLPDWNLNSLRSFKNKFESTAVSLQGIMEENIKSAIKPATDAEN